MKKDCCLLISNKVIVEENDLKSQLIQKGFGEKQENGELILDLKEALFLIENKKIEIKDINGKNVSQKQVLKLAQKKEAKFYTKFVV